MQGRKRGRSAGLILDQLRLEGDVLMLAVTADQTEKQVIDIVDQLRHRLGIGGFKVIDLYAGIGSLLDLGGQHRIDKYGRAGKRVEQLLLDWLKVPADIDQTAEVVPAYIGEKLLKLFVLVLNEIVIIKKHDRIVGIMQSVGQFFLQGAV